MKKLWTLLAAATFCMSSTAIDQVDGWYQISTAQDLVDFSAIVNGGTNNIKGVLLNDIDMSSVDNFTPIGLFDDNGPQISFAGEFNGNGFVVKNLNVVREDGYEVGMFSRVWNGGRVYNLGVVNSHFESKNNIRAGAIGGEIAFTSLTNCFGLNNVVISTFQQGGLTGEAAGTTFTNCYTDHANLSGAMGDFNNCRTSVSSEDLMSGKLCFEMNNGRTYTPVWHQDLKNGGYPVANASVPQVTKLLSTGEYTNDHNFVNGVCRECVDYFYQEDYMTPEADGYYHISTPEQLMWFSVYACHFHDHANAKLIADIDMSGITDYYGIGLCGGSEDYPYRGIFDGQGHVISNLTVTTDLEAGFFGRSWGATISNLGFTGDFVITSTGNQRSGVLGGEMADSRVNNVFVCANSITYNTTSDQKGALGGEGAMSTYNNCYTTEATFTGYDDKFDTYFVNCYNSASDGFAAKAASGELCYLLNGDQSVITWYQTIGVDPYPMFDSSRGRVYQNGTQNCDGSPQSVSYANTNDGIVRDPHTFVDGYCSACSTPDPDYVTKNASGFYEISSVAEFKWFSALVNSGDRAKNAVLTADIDMAGVSFEPIGYADLGGLNHDGQDISNPGFAGQFDGQGHKITNLTALYGPAYAASGIFGTITGTVKNLGVENYRFNYNEDYTGAAYGLRAGALCGQLVEGTILNCYVINSTVAKDGEIVSTIAAGNYGGTIQNCYGYNNTVVAYPRDGHVGMLVGDAGDDRGRRVGTEINCYAEGGCVTNGRGSNVVGIEDNVSAERFASGEIACKLGTAFRQNIGEDAYPVLDATHGIVNQITEAGYATQYIEETDVEIPEGVEAYAGVMIDNAKLALKPIEDKIAAGEPVVLKGAAGYYSFVPTTGAVKAEANDLKGTAIETQADGTMYVLAKPEGKEIGFYQVYEGETIKAGKAYCQSASGVKAFYFEGDEDATGISTINNGQWTMDNAVIYNVAGQRIQKMQKGINIVNGKKVLK